MSVKARQAAEFLPTQLHFTRVYRPRGFNKSSAKAMLLHDLPDEEAEKLADMLPKQPYISASPPQRTGIRMMT